MSVRRVESEDARLRAQWAYEGLDPVPEAECDEIVRLAASFCGAAVGFLTLLDDRRQWYRVSDGFKLEETPREVAFCAHAIRQTDLFIVTDALADDRFAQIRWCGWSRRSGSMRGCLCLARMGSARDDVRDGYRSADAYLRSRRVAAGVGAAGSGPVGAAAHRRLWKMR